MVNSSLRRRLVLEDLIRRAATDWYSHHDTTDLWHSFLIDILEEARATASERQCAA